MSLQTQREPTAALTPHLGSASVVNKNRTQVLAKSSAPNRNGTEKDGQRSPLPHEKGIQRQDGGQVVLSDQTATLRRWAFLHSFILCSPPQAAQLSGTPEPTTAVFVWAQNHSQRQHTRALDPRWQKCMCTAHMPTPHKHT